VKFGYFWIETHRNRPGVVRLVVSTESPDPAPAVHADRRIRYIAHFNDREAALMHVHEFLKRRLLDPDRHLYRVPVERAIAAAESVVLKHRRIYIDPDFNDEDHASMAALSERFRQSGRRKDLLFRTLGYIGIGLLLFNLLFLSFP